MRSVDETGDSYSSLRTFEYGFSSHVTTDCGSAFDDDPAQEDEFVETDKASCLEFCETKATEYAESYNHLDLLETCCKVDEYYNLDPNLVQCYFNDRASYGLILNTESIHHIDLCCRGDT